MELIRLFEPITINNMVLKNRIVMPSMGLAYTDRQEFNERLAAFYLERVRGGAGFIIVGPCAIDKAGSVPFMVSLADEGNLPALSKFLDEAHATSDAKIGVQLLHMGRYALSWLSGEPCLAPSAVPSRLTGETPREMTKDDLRRVRGEYVAAARRAVSAGFDAVEILACTGYLMSQFLSVVTNQRADEYGGSPENRMRFPLEVLAGVRAALGPGVPLGMRIAGNEFMPGGNTNAESAEFAARAEAVGIDFVNVTGGWHETNVPQLTANVPPGAYLYLARGVKDAVTVPVFASNRLGDPVVAERALRAGMCDLICWGRPLLADPGLPEKARAGRLGEVVPCIACNQGCFDTVFLGQPVTCVMNPGCGHEFEPVPAPGNPRRVFVAGGGPAGLSFAVTAAARGHKVTLFESSDRLGGQVLLAQAPPGKAEFKNAVASLVSRAREAGVEFRLNTPLTPVQVKEEKPDLVVAATGAVPVAIKIPGADRPHVVDAWDVLAEKVPHIGKNVVIVGGSATGCETAHYVSRLDAPDDATLAFLLLHNAETPEFLAGLCHRTRRNVTVIDLVDKMAANVGKTSRWSLMKCLRQCNVNLKPNTRLLGIENDCVVVETPAGRESIPADTVILAVGAKSRDDLAQALEHEKVPVIPIGDAKSPRRITEAIREGYLEGLKV